LIAVAFVAHVSVAHAQDAPPAPVAATPAPAAPSPSPSTSPAIEPAPIPSAAEATPSALPVETASPLTVEQLVQGTCRSPREAILQLLYWIPEGGPVAGTRQNDRARAAACMDPTGVADPNRLGKLAYQLKRAIDLQGYFVDLDSIPADANFVDAAGISRYRLPDLAEVEVVRIGERWLFSRRTVREIPRLYDSVVPPTIQRIVGALPAWAHTTFLGVHLWQLLGLLLLLFVGLAIQKTVVYLIGTYLRSITGRLRVRWIDAASQRIDRPIGGLVMAGVFYAAFPWLQFSVRVSVVANVATQLLAVASLAWLGYRMIDVLMDWLDDKAELTASKLDDQLVPLARKTLKVFVAVIGSIFVLQNLDVDVGSLLAGLGLGGLAFALAAKDTVANFFGSVVIFIDKPFQIGDWVVIGGCEGTVEEVGFRTTKVRTFYDSLVTVPNATLTSANIDNYGARRYRRYTCHLGLTYDTPPEKIQAFCEGVRAIIQGMPGMRKDYYFVEFHQFGESSLDVLLYCFMDVPSWGAELRTRSHLNLEVVRIARELGLSFAFPTRTLHVDTLAEPAKVEPRVAYDQERLASIVHAFAPNGKLARPEAVKLTSGYDPAAPASTVGAADAGE
jgi:MscS family membrane protein